MNRQQDSTGYGRFVSVTATTPPGAHVGRCGLCAWSEYVRGGNALGRHAKAWKAAREHVERIHAAYVHDAEKMPIRWRRRRRSDRTFDYVSSCGRYVIEPGFTSVALAGGVGRLGSPPRPSSWSAQKVADYDRVGVTFELAAPIDIEIAGRAGWYGDAYLARVKLSCERHRDRELRETTEGFTR